MKHVTSAFMILALAGAANAGSVFSGWEVEIDYGTGPDQVQWFASAYPEAFNITQSEGPNGPIYRISGAWATDLWSCNWEVTSDPDPFVSSSFTIQNMGPALAPFVITVTAPSMALFAPSSMSGSISGTIGDGNGLADIFGNGGTVQTIGFPGGGAPYYEAMVDFATVRTLYNAPQRDSAIVGGTNTIPTMSFGPEAGPAVLATIGIRNSFELTAGDNASFTSTFLIVPTPAGAGILGLAGLAMIRRRR